MQQQYPRLIFIVAAALAAALCVTSGYRTRLASASPITSDSSNNNHTYHSDHNHTHADGSACDHHSHDMHHHGGSPGTGVERKKRDASNVNRDSASLRDGNANGSNRKNNKSKKSFEMECLAAHNKWRRLHGAKELKFDSKVSRSVKDCFV